MNKKETLLIVVLVWNVVILGVNVSLLWYTWGNPLTVSELIEDYPIDCTNKPIDQAAGCYVNAIKPFYKYRYTDAGQDVQSDIELFSLGGDCRDWANYYEKVGEQLGYYSTTLSIGMNKTSSHAIAIWSMNSTYCVIDQNTLWCNELG